MVFIGRYWPAQARGGVIVTHFQTKGGWFVAPPGRAALRREGERQAGCPHR